MIQPILTLTVSELKDALRKAKARATIAEQERAAVQMRLDEKIIQHRALLIEHTALLEEMEAAETEIALLQQSLDHVGDDY